MRAITGIEVQRGGGRRAHVFLDGEPAFSLDVAVATEQGLALGQALSDSRVEEILRAERHHRCRQAALRLLGYRPRSEKEIRDRLVRRFDGETIDDVVSELAGRQAIDDEAFARFWRDNRESFSPRGRGLLRAELRAKGVAAEVVDEVVQAVDEEEGAYRAAQRKARTLEPDYEAFRRRLGDFLRRRGYSYGVASRTVERLWRELGH